MENKLARTYLRRADFEQWVSVKVVLGAGTRELVRGDNKLTAKHAGGGWKAC